MQNSTSDTPAASSRAMRVFGWTALISGGLSLISAIQTLFTNPHAFASDPAIGAILATFHYSQNTALSADGVIMQRNGFARWVFAIPLIAWPCMSAKAGVDLLAMRKGSVRTYLIALGVLIAVNLAVFRAVDFLGIAYTYAVYHFLWKRYQGAERLEE